MPFESARRSHPTPSSPDNDPTASSPYPRLTPALPELCFGRTAHNSVLFSRRRSEVVNTRPNVFPQPPRHTVASAHRASYRFSTHRYKYYTWFRQPSHFSRTNHTTDYSPKQWNRPWIFELPTPDIPISQAFLPSSSISIALWNKEPTPLYDPPGYISAPKAKLVKSQVPPL